MHKLTSHSDWIARARAVLPAGGFGNFDPGVVIARGEGSHVWDEDGKAYIDYLIGSGPMLLGHGHPKVMEAVLEQLPKGMTFFANNAKGIALAEAIVDAAPCCAQERYGVTPDICTLGKIIGGGFPLAALGASAEIIQHFDKSIVGGDKWLMQLGTLSGNPIAAAAGLKTTEVLKREGSYDRLRDIGRTLQDMQSSALYAAGIPHQICGDETLFDIFFTANPCRDYRSARHDDPARNATYNKPLRQHGIFKSPGKLYPSLAITPDDLEQTKAAVEHAVRSIAVS